MTSGYDDHGLPCGSRTRRSSIHSSPARDVGSRQRGLSLWIACLGFTALVGLLAFPLLSSRSTWGSHGAPSAIASNNSSQLAIQLHPAEHSVRDPTTLTFEWNITLGRRAPDGVEKEVYLVNGGFPGPTIEARSGDRIRVDVHNGLETEGVSLHWHGLRMQGFNAMDGAVGFTQCPIPAGGGFVYDFRIGDDEHGTFWWHGHSQAQRGDGLFGGLIVHQPHQSHDSVQEEDESLLLVGDWFHRKQTDVLAWYADAGSVGNEPVPDSMLVNGRGRYDCSMAVPAKPVQCSLVTLSTFPPLLQKPTARTRLRVVNTGTIAGLTLQVNGARLQAIQVDGGCSVEAQPTSSVGILYPGERVDLALAWIENHSEQRWLNIYLDDENFGFQNPALNPKHKFPALPRNLSGIVKAETPSPELSHSHQDLRVLSSTESPSRGLPTAAQKTILLYIKTQKLAVHGNKPLGFVNHTTWEPQDLPLLSQNRSSWDSHQLVPFIGTGSRPTWVKLVLNNLDDGSHPFHLHGDSFYVLSSYRAEGRDGFGSYNPYETLEDESPGLWNRDKPVRKDTINVPRRGHVVLTMLAANTGIWMFHCHMLVHQGTGMALGLHVGPVDDEDHVLGLDESAAKLCDAVK